MGSKSWSTTNYSSVNTPLSLQDADNAIALAGSSQSQIGGQGNVNGNNSGVINLLDGGAIKEALGLGEKSITTVADLTAKFLEQTSAANVEALNFAGRQADSAMQYVNEVTNKDGTAEKNTNTTLWVFGGLVALYLLVRYGKGVLNAAH